MICEPLIRVPSMQADYYTPKAARQAPQKQDQVLGPTLDRGRP